MEQGRVNGAPIERRIHSWRFTSLLCKTLRHLYLCVCGKIGYKNAYCIYDNASGYYRKIVLKKYLLQIYILNLFRIILVKQSINIKRDEINIMNCINNNGFNLNNSLLNNGSGYMKVSLSLSWKELSGT